MTMWPAPEMGWGDSVDITATQATVRINAWVLTPINFAETSSFAFAKNSLMTGTISLSQNIDLDSHLVILEVYIIRPIIFIQSESNCNMFYKHLYIYLRSRIFRREELSV